MDRGYHNLRPSPEGELFTIGAAEFFTVLTPIFILKHFYFVNIDTSPSTTLAH